MTLPLLFACCALLATAPDTSQAPVSGFARVEQLLEDGEYAEAEAEAHKLLEAIETSESPDDLFRARHLLLRSLILPGRANDDATLELATTAVRECEESQPRQPELLARALSDLANVQRQRGGLEEALTTAERALRVRNEVGDRESIATATELVASVLTEMGRYAEAVPHYERAIEELTEIHGPDSAELAPKLANHARLLRRMGSFSAADRTYRRTLALVDVAYGPEHPLRAYVLNGQGILADEMGEFTEARRLYEEAIAVAEGKLSASFVADVQNNLGLSLQRLGDLEGAERVLREALRAQREADSPNVATFLANLADVVHASGRFDEGMRLMEEAMELVQAQHGAEHPEVATHLVSMAAMKMREKEFDAARDDLRRALAIRTKAFDEDNPHLAQVFQELGRLELSEGNLDDATQELRQALEIHRHTLGDHHPLVGRAMGDLSLSERRSGHLDESLELALGADAIAREHIRRTTTMIPEREALLYAASRGRYLNIALTACASRADSDLVERVWTGTLRGRALVLDELSRRAKMLARLEGPGLTSVERQWIEATTRYSNILVRGLRSGTDHDTTMLEDARRDQERLERLLLEDQQSSIAEIRVEEPDLTAILASLPASTSLVAYVRFENVDAAQNVDRYLAFVAGTKEPPSLVSLGEAHVIDEAVAAWRTEMRSIVVSTRTPSAESEARYRRLGARVRELVWDPIEARVAGSEMVLLVLDGMLHHVSFEALPVGTDEYLLDRDFVLHYLSAERDALVATATSHASGGLLVVGGVDFDLARDDRSDPSREKKLSESPARRGAECVPWRDLRFVPLPGTEREATSIERLWNEVVRRPATLLTGSTATESAIRSAASDASVLHLATHGFFLSEACSAPADRLRGFGAVVSDDTPQVVIASPFRLSGLALAGANRGGDGDQDGILTAAEVSTLDLSSTEWAVLSACDSGTGEVRGGEGVLGLRRSLQMAGAETIITSLWSVDDQLAERWMEILYKAHFADGLGTAQAAREASRALLMQSRRSGDSSHPSQWAGFVAIGDWN